MLDERQKRTGRRTFLRTTAALPAAGALAWSASELGSINTAMIGTGVEGQLLLKHINPNYLKVSAVCDINPVNREAGMRTVHDLNNPEAKAYESYQDVLAIHEIEAVIIATPLWLHAPITIAALNAGKHVFCETAMAKTVEECQSMNQAASKNNRVLQIGHQRFYNPVYHDGYQIIKSGLLGDIYHVRALWHQNQDWKRRVTRDDERAVSNGMNPQAFQYDSLEHLVNWRLYDKYSGGLASELMTHQIACVNWFLGATPTKVFASGGTYKYKEGDRSVPDHIFCTFEYPNNCTLTYSAIQTNSHDEYYEMYMGTQGTLIMGGETQSYLFWESGYEPDLAKRATEMSIANEAAGPVGAAGPTRQPRRSRPDEGRQSEENNGMNALEPYRIELEGFAHAIRAGAPVLCNGETAMAAAAAAFAANQAISSEQKVNINSVIA